MLKADRKTARRHDRTDYRTTLSAVDGRRMCTTAQSITTALQDLQQFSHIVIALTALFTGLEQLWS